MGSSLFLHITTSPLLLPPNPSLAAEVDPGESMTDSGVDSEVSPSSPDSVSADAKADAVLHLDLPGHPVTGPPVHSPEELVARMELDGVDDEGEFFISDERVADKMETVEALLSLSSSAANSPEKTLITILPAHNPDKGERGVKVRQRGRLFGKISLL